MTDVDTDVETEVECIRSVTQKHARVRVLLREIYELEATPNRDKAALDAAYEALEEAEAELRSAIKALAPYCSPGHLEKITSESWAELDARIAAGGAQALERSGAAEAAARTTALPLEAASPPEVAPPSGHEFDELRNAEGGDTRSEATSPLTATSHIAELVPEAVQQGSDEGARTDLSRLALACDERV